MTTIAFQPDIIHSQASLAQFLSGDDAVASILQASPASTVTPLGHSWDNGFIDLNELYYLASCVFLTLGSYLLHVVSRDLSNRLWVESRHAMSLASAIKTDKIFQKHLLARSINTHQRHTDDYYSQSPQKTTLATHPTPGVLNFFHQDGICRGMCLWFAYLYLKTKEQFSDSDLHMKAIGEQFAEGAPRQAAFLHSLDLSQLYELLHLSVRTDYSQIEVLGKTREQICAELQCRAPGAYGIYTSTHQLIFIRLLDESKQYLFDPSTGTMNVASPTLFQEVMAPYFQTHDSTKKIYVDHYVRLIQ